MDIKTEILKLAVFLILSVFLIKIAETIPKVLKRVTSPQKENLVLVHSFPTNSILLAGLIDYLDDYFNVYFIDLPGFSQKTPALQEITIDSYARYVERQIESYNLSSYNLAGISFGFAVVNRVNVGSSCKSIIAIEPYLNKNYLQMGSLKTFLYSHLADYMAQNLELTERFWKNDYADEVFSMLTGQPKETTETILKEIDGRTFFTTAKFLVADESDLKFSQTIPYVLFINADDETVDAEKIERLFIENVPAENLKIVHTDIEHYPSDISKKYFESKLNISDLYDVFDWVNEKRAQIIN